MNTIGVLWVFVALTILGTAHGRIHKLEIRGDNRRYIALTTFGFYEGGNLTVNLINFKATPVIENSIFGFSLDRTRSDAMNPYLDSHQERCLLQNANGPKTDLESKDESSVIYLVMDFKSKVLRVNCSNNVKSLHLSHNPNGFASSRSKRRSGSFGLSDTALFPRKKRDTAPHEEKGEQAVSHEKFRKCSDIYIPISEDIIKGEKYYNTSFTMLVTNPEEEGRYNLFFHSCPNYDYKTPVEIDFTMRLVTKNRRNFLSAGEMPLPSLYFMMSLLFFLSGVFWVFILKQSKNQVFKIHYLMAVLVFLKSLSLLFHGINFHFIQTKGEHVAAWAILYYITHLLKGAVLFITIVLVGTGWDFIKHILADKDKKIFMIVIPLQVLANVAEIIIEESEEGDIEHKTWRDVFILVDLLCCGAILFPVAWSIKHLQESANTDGKAAVNLEKLKLFRHFYIMIVCYIYFTRIIVYLLKMTVPFQYEWLDEMFREMATYVFFVLTGYKFRPASANPYFTVNDDLAQNDDDDDETDIVVSGVSGITESLGKVARASKVIRPTTIEISVNDEERDSLINKREASHEYD